jgi:hypothetical protein
MINQTAKEGCFELFDVIQARQWTSSYKGHILVIPKLYIHQQDPLTFSGR